MKKSLFVLGVLAFPVLANAQPINPPGIPMSQKGAANGVATLGNTTHVPLAQLGTGTPSSTTFLNGLGAWAVPAGGGGGVSSFNTRTGAVNLLASDLTGLNIGTTTGTYGDGGVLASVQATANAALPILNQVQYRAVSNKFINLHSDGKRLFDVTTTATSAVVTSASYSFQSSDVGKSIEIFTAFPQTLNSSGVYNGPATGGIPLVGTIASVSGGAATLSVTAATSIAGTAYGEFGTPDDAALQTLITDVNGAGGGIINFEGLTILANSESPLSNVGYVGQSQFNTGFVWINPSTSGTTGMFIYNTATATNPWRNIVYRNLQFDMTGYLASTYNVAQKALQGQYFIGLDVDHDYFIGTPATSVGTDYLKNAHIDYNVATDCGRLGATGSAFGASCYGIGTWGNSTWVDQADISHNIANMPTAFGGNYGVFVETQNQLSPLSHMTLDDDIVFLNSANQKGIGVSGVFGTLVSNANVYGSGATGQRGVSIDLGTVTVTSSDPIGKVSNSYVTNTDIGYVYLATGSSQTSKSYTFENDTAYLNLSYGFEVYAGAEGVFYLKIEGGAASLNGSDGIILAGTGSASHISIQDFQSYANGTSTGGAAAQAGLAITIPVNTLLLTGDNFFDGGSGKQLYGIYDSGNVTNASFYSNIVGTNATGPFDFVGATITGSFGDNTGMPAASVSGCSATIGTGSGAVGKYVSGTAGSCAATILPYGTTSLIANNGWIATASDMTTPADAQTQSASTTTGVTVTGTTALNDNVVYQLRSY